MHAFRTLSPLEAGYFMPYFLSDPQLELRETCPSVGPAARLQVYLILSFAAVGDKESVNNRTWVRVGYGAFSEEWPRESSQWVGKVP